MQLVPIAGATCASANCPTVYVNDEDQDIFVQGYSVPDQRLPAGPMPPGEALVRIPREVFLAAARDLPARA
ncbi:hypothetical protein [Frankia sp. AgB32]|uniref:hypothetical protein n=1 Tax=Frankia sp. AgB32 TaxID=631119 RepID=UPI00200BB895|nr:hypothetical protein [Frankia sp. AgB32]MCK9895133.1 hypothetical protein [Frankia sp. AgB32]